MIRELKRDKVVKDYDYVSIKIASPEKIRDWSYGEVTRPETINYRTLKPEKDGLFCERIFGPEKDYECSCGKYKKYRFKGLICDRCGVEVTSSKVRRQRMGHIELAVPVAHLWFVKQIPSPIQLLLDLKSKELVRVLYYESYIVLNPGASEYNVGDVIDEESYQLAKEKYPTGFEAEMGAEPIRELLSEIELNDEVDKLRTSIKFETKQAKAKLIKKLKIVDAFLNSGNRPEWMILETIPVMPPDLRPLVYLEGGSFATADFNDLYRRVITRNNRLKALIEGHAPEVILRNEKRILQEAVDALLDNSRKSRPVKGRGNRPLKSLSDQLKGKKGRFRQNLLGKRVDYSGRSVIVIGPDLHLNQCGLPKKMALELFKPYIIERIEKFEGVSTTKQAKRLMEEKKPEVWKILEEVIKDYPVLLNRAPTLHRLSMQAFIPVLIEEKAIQLHPLLCYPFNADFDGDQMAVHIPLSGEAQMEARALMTPVNNILSPANGKPVLMASQDIVLGVYFLTTATSEEPDDLKGLPKFNSTKEVLIGYELQGTKSYQKYYDNEEDIGLHIHSWIEFRCKATGRRIVTTVGRVIFNQIIPEDISFKNYSFDKGKINQLTYEVYEKYGAERTAYYLDDLKNIGFQYATKSGTTFGMVDIIVPKEKVTVLESSENEVIEIQDEYDTGIITESERYDRLIDQWKIATEEITDRMMEELKEDRQGFNPIWIMAVSGARGGRDQIKQLGAMRGLMEKPSRKLTGEMGEIIENPIKSNFKEGLSILEYFISTHGARKGLADTALKTADAGYLTRRLVDVAQSVVISTYDCGTMQGVDMTALKEGNKTIEPLSDRIKGRTAVEEVIDPVSEEIIVEAGETISDAKANTIQKHGIRKVRIRSVLTCEADKGICAKCYGRDLSTGKPVTIGTPVGVIAAQSIGEPGTQLTLRTFHIGGAASTLVEKAEVNAEKDGIVKYDRLDYVVDRDDQKIASSYQGMVLIVDPESKEELSRYKVEYGATIYVSEDQKVVKDTLLFSWDNYNTPLISTVKGTVYYDDFIDDETYKTEFNELTGRTELTILESRDVGKQAQLIIEIIEDDKKKKIRVPLPPGLNLEIEEGSRVFPGEILGKTSRVTVKQRDITGGLPRVVELFEARSPSSKAVITEIDGVVKIGKLTRLGRKVTISSESTGIDQDYTIPYGRRIIVHEGDVVENGDPLSDGPLDPHDILTAKGVVATQEFITNEILEIYRKQGVDINDKHIRVIVRQMMQKVKILDPGDTIFLEGEIVDKLHVKKVNLQVEQDGGRVATFEQLLMGITKSALITDSFISAASFQNTTKVLTEASVYGKVDTLEGLKESVIIGHRIPAGTGDKYWRKMVQDTLDDELSLKKTVDKLLPDGAINIEDENVENNIQEQEA